MQGGCSKATHALRKGSSACWLAVRKRANCRPQGSGAGVCEVQRKVRDGTCTFQPHVLCFNRLLSISCNQMSAQKGVTIPHTPLPWRPQIVLMSIAAQNWNCKSDKHVECATFLQMPLPLLLGKDDMGTGKGGGSKKASHPPNW